jgi:hypothetical protein|tara:strand:+ start:320 stop:562 length:243 start_codon:yes stop_codon:yes gene_type:complete
MSNKKTNMFDDLSFINGKQESQQSKPATKKTKEKKVNKKSYSYEDLKNKASDQLTEICKELNIPIVRRKVEMIEKILNNN